MLKAAGGSRSRLGSLIVAAIESGGRLGELLDLRRADVSLSRDELTFRAAKTDKDRTIPLSRRLKAVLELELSRTNPDGAAFGPQVRIFGDILGRRLKSIKKAWMTCVLKANGHTPTWAPGRGQLSADSRAAYHSIDLQFRDCRHKAGSRWFEGGIPLHEVSAILGHSSIEQTSTYLNVQKHGLHKSMKALDERRAKFQEIASQTTMEQPSPCNLSDTPAAKVVVN